MHSFKTPMKSVQYGLCIILSAFLLASCGEESKLTRHIPKDAAGVLALDVKSLALKSMDFQELLKFENLQKIFESSDDSIGNAVRNSGIDFMNKAYVFGKSVQPGEGYGAAVVALTDAAAFETFVKKLAKDAPISDEGDFKTIAIEEGAVVTWNKTEAIVVMGQGNIKEAAHSLAALKKEESIAGNVATFDELEKKEADIAVWVNMGAAQGLVPQSPYSATPAMDMKETYMMASCNFEDGQIVVDSKYITNAETTKKFDFMKSSVSGDVLETLPGNTVIALLGFGIDMAKLTSYLESENLLATYDPLIQQSSGGLAAKDLLGMLTGDVAFTVNGAVMKEVPRINYLTGEEVIGQAPDFDYSIVVGVANKETVTKLLTYLSGAGQLVKKENYYSLNDELFVEEKGNVLVITRYDEKRKAIVDGRSEKLNGDLTALFTNNAAAMYFNSNNIPAEFLGGQNALYGTHLSNLELEDITYTSSAVKDNVTTGRFVIRFKTKDENSLITISKISKKYGDLFAPPSFVTPIDSTEVVDITAEEAEADAIE